MAAGRCLCGKMRTRAISHTNRITHLCNTANLCSSSLFLSAWLSPFTTAMTSLAILSGRCFPPFLLLALRIQSMPWRARWRSVRGMGNTNCFAARLKERQRRSGPAANTASRTIGSGGALVNACTWRSILDTTRAASCRLPWRMTSEVKRCSSGSSAGGIVGGTGGAAATLEAAGKTEEVEAAGAPASGMLANTEDSAAMAPGSAPPVVSVRAAGTGTRRKAALAAAWRMLASIFELVREIERKVGNNAM